MSPLDWGLGHATRTSCLVGRLLSEGHIVTLAGSGPSIKLLSDDYPELECLELRSFSPWFFRYLPQWLAIIVQVPKFVVYYLLEKNRLKHIARVRVFDMIVSDNRYGLRLDGCRNVLVTHQLSPIIAMWAPNVLNRMFGWMLARWINRFDEVWVPDDKPYPCGLVGELSNPRFIKTRVKTIGILSRLSRNVLALKDKSKIDYLAIISGPEPQRSMMEEEVRRMFGGLTGEKVILDGKSYTKPEDMSNIIERAENIYCRSGYSTIMDLIKLGKVANLLPTSGQAEQEYLCERMLSYGFVRWK